MHRTRILSIAAALALSAALPAAAQTAEQPKGSTVSGRVVDALSGQGVSRVSIRIPALDRAAVTNDDGYFLLQGLEEGEYEWAFDRIGYALLKERSAVRDGDRLTVAIMPRPEVLEALVVTANVFEAQRRRITVPVRALDEDEILASGRSNPVELLAGEGVNVGRCGEEACVRWRGGYIRPVVFIDEVPAFHGLTDLAGIPAQDLYVLESYDNGRMVRVYTRNFIEHLAIRGRQPRDLAILAMYHQRGNQLPRP